MSLAPSTQCYLPQPWAVGLKYQLWECSQVCPAGCQLFKGKIMFAKVIKGAPFGNKNAAGPRNGSAASNAEALEKKMKATWDSTYETKRSEGSSAEESMRVAWETVRAEQDSVGAAAKATERAANLAAESKDFRARLEASRSTPSLKK